MYQTSSCIRVQWVDYLMTDDLKFRLMSTNHTLWLLLCQSQIKGIIMTIACGAYSAGCVYSYAINLCGKLYLALLLAPQGYSICIFYFTNYYQWVIFVSPAQEHFADNADVFGWWGIGRLLLRKSDRHVGSFYLQVFVQASKSTYRGRHSYN